MGFQSAAERNCMPIFAGVSFIFSYLEFCQLAALQCPPVGCGSELKDMLSKN
jgi:hypothetical protein